MLCDRLAPQGAGLFVFRRRPVSAAMRAISSVRGGAPAVRENSPVHGNKKFMVTNPVGGSSQYGGVPFSNLRGRKTHDDQHSFGIWSPGSRPFVRPGGCTDRVSPG